MNQILWILFRAHLKGSRDPAEIVNNLEHYRGELSPILDEYQKVLGPNWKVPSPEEFLEFCEAWRNLKKC